MEVRPVLYSACHGTEDLYKIVTEQEPIIIQGLIHKDLLINFVAGWNGLRCYRLQSVHRSPILTPVSILRWGMVEPLFSATLLLRAPQPPRPSPVGGVVRGGEELPLLRFKEGGGCACNRRRLADGLCGGLGKARLGPEHGPLLVGGGSVWEGWGTRGWEEGTVGRGS